MAKRPERTDRCEFTELPEEILGLFAALMGAPAMSGEGHIIVVLGAPSSAPRGCPAKASFAQAKGGLPTHRLSTNFEEVDAGKWKVWFADDSTSVVGNRTNFARIPISAPCARRSIRAVSDEADGTPGKYECQYVEAVLSMGSLAYMGPQRVATHGYQGWLLLELPDGAERTIYFTGPDQFGIPRVWELVVYRNGEERHTRTPSAAEQRRAPRFKVVPSGNHYSVQLVK